MSKPWQPYALHILDAIERIRNIQARGDLTLSTFARTHSTEMVHWVLRRIGI